MPSSRLSLQLLPHEDELLRTLYREFEIPTDQYPRRPEDLARLVSTWNNLAGRNDPAPDVLHYMITKRKKKKWERLGWNAGSDFSPSQELTAENDLKILDAIHEDLQIASDNYALHGDAAKRLQDEFARRTGRIIPSMVLAATMIHRRKAGALATLKPKPKDSDLGFSDIDKVAN